MGYKMNMSYYTDSAMLQTMMEIPLEKKAGRLYAPPGKLQMIYFIDDLNMPALDKYNTQSAIELIKQKQDYSHWYDRAKIQVKVRGLGELLGRYLGCLSESSQAQSYPKFFFVDFTTVFKLSLCTPNLSDPWTNILQNIPEP